jgi:hypothetical protein
MSIKRILNPIEFDKVADDIYNLFKEDDTYYGHELLTHDVEMIKKSFGHISILNWDFFVWANETNGIFDSVICFTNDRNPKFGNRVFGEFLWLSKNPKTGYKLFTTAVKYAKENEFDTLLMSTVVKNPKHEKIKRFYKKIGLLKDSETYICKL